MDKVLQTVGTLLLLGVLMLGILTYSNVAGIGDNLRLIKEGVDRLVGWFIPTRSNVTISVAEYAGVSATVSGNKVVVNANLSAGTTYTDLVRIEVTTDKEATIVLSVSNGCPTIALPFRVTATNAIVDKTSITVPASGSTVEKIVVYPIGTGKVGISLSITPDYDTSGTITIEVVLSYLK
jgi:hypothetical protein